MNPYILTFALILAIGTGGAGSVKGRADNEAKHIAALAQAQAETLAAIKKAKAAESKRLAAEQAVRMQNRELEDLARAQPATHPECLSLDRSLRLNKR